MAITFLGFDHVDVRVRSLAEVEAFYDRLMFELGLTTKTTAYVDSDGRWQSADAAHPYNAVEYHEPVVSGKPERFIGFIEDAGMLPTGTRIAFALERKEDVPAWEVRLRALGAREVELNDDMDDYPAVFFCDPSGTRLELCARRPKA